MMKIKFFPVVLFILIAQYTAIPENQKPDPFLNWVIGEELIYKVKWSFIKLGELKLKVLESDTIGKNEVFRCRIFVDSSPGLPFITIHDMYESWVDADSFYSHLFRSIEKKGNDTLFTEYNFDYSRNEVDIRIERKTPDAMIVNADCSATIPGKVFDSLSMLYYARAMSRNTFGQMMPVFVYNEFKYMKINFSGELKEIELKDRNIFSFYVDGRLKFVGIAGVKDKFEGWFSPDKQSIPLEASMKAFIGSVKIYLNTWTGWEDASRFFDDK
ncbi:MAG: DUF3108 domain-containing protein [Calditrichaeota bacterium]|nr:DUF3108 domain-containing protein [Calditrichota bacterium]RQW01428.1 MAG: DUF3108 domain-containing protein [Calditrichota bacterium]